MVPKDAHAPIPRICQYLTLHGETDAKHVTKLCILRWVGYPGLSWAPCNHRGAYEEEAEGSESM